LVDSLLLSYSIQNFIEYYWYKDVPKRIARAKETKANISATNI